jgi:hypothetical protein
MTTEELKRQLIQLPEQYEEALRKQTEKIVVVKRLEFEIEKLKGNPAKLVENNSLEEDADEDLIALDAELERLKLRLAESECKVELNIRVSNGKVTESHVKALVTTDENVSQLRKELIEAKTRIKIRKAELQRKRSELWEKKRHNNDVFDGQEGTELKNKLLLAEEESFFANDQVEVLKVKLDTLQLLTSLSEQ